MITQRSSSYTNLAVLLLAIYSANYADIQTMTPNYILRYRVFQLRIKISVLSIPKASLKELNTSADENAHVSKKQHRNHVNRILHSLYNLFFSDEVKLRIEKITPSI